MDMSEYYGGLYPDPPEEIEKEEKNESTSFIIDDVELKKFEEEADEKEFEDPKEFDDEFDLDDEFSDLKDEDDINISKEREVEY